MSRRYIDSVSEGMRGNGTIRRRHANPDNRKSMFNHAKGKNMKKQTKRKGDRLRPIEFIRNFTKHGESLDALPALARKGLKRIFGLMKR